MRLLYLTASYPYGGAESFLHEEVAALVRAGVDVAVWPVRPGTTVRSDFFESGAHMVRRRRLDLRALSECLMWSASNPRNFFAILRILAGDRRHFVKNLLVLPAGVSAGKYAIRHRVSHVHAHWLSTSATVALIASRVSFVPFSVTAHRWDIVDGNLLEEKYAAAAFVRFISRSGVDLSRQRHGVLPDRSPVVHLGVRTARPVSALEPTYPSFKILVPAALKPVKGHHGFLEALTALPSLDGLQVDFSGDGPLANDIGAEVEIRGLDQSVTLRGNVPHAALMEAMHRGDYDAVVLPSIDMGNGTHEGVPVSLMEAMSAGIPVISTRTGGIPELISDDYNGLLVAGGDSVALAAAILRLWRDADLRERLSVNGLSTIKEKFDAARNARSMIGLMQTES